MRIGWSDLLTNDITINMNSLTIAAVDNFVHGRARLDTATRTIIFVPDPNYTGPASFDYRVDDGQGGSAIARVTIDVKAARHPS